MTAVNEKPQPTVALSFFPSKGRARASKRPSHLHLPEITGEQDMRTGKLRLQA